MTVGAGDGGAIRSLGGRAEENLQFIRRTMERSATFTAVPGVGGVVMGTVGVLGAMAAASQPSPERWLLVWLAAAVVAFAAGVIAIWRKGARIGAPLTGPLGRRFALGSLAPVVAGAALTWGLWKSATWALMPPAWLLLYGAGVLTGGVFSIAAVRLLGVAFMALGILALLTPAAWADVWLGLGFGGLQIACGLYIAKHLGG